MESALTFCNLKVRFGDYKNNKKMKAEKVVFTRICNGGNPLTDKFEK